MSPVWPDAGEIALYLGLLALLGSLLRPALARVAVPGAVGFMVLGFVAGPSALDQLPESLLGLRIEIMKAAFVVVLIRAGVGLETSALRQVAGRALWLGTVPLLVEIVAIAALLRATGLIDTTGIALLAGFLVAAISPAVVIPSLQEHKERGAAGDSDLPDAILAITVVSVLLAETGIRALIDVHADDVTLAARAARLPLEIAGGCLLGALTGIVAAYARPPAWLLMLIAQALFFGTAWLGGAGLIAVLTAGMVLRARAPAFANGLRPRLARQWLVAEILLFAALGSMLRIESLTPLHRVAILCGVLLIAVLSRLAMTRILAHGEPSHERRHHVVSQLPKATVQAVYGGVPLALHLEAGGASPFYEAETLLILSVASIVLTAPLGAWLLEHSGRRLHAGRTPPGSGA
jgi:NhaP-type Na+/H+ or K+/H+ antiporter